jgi:YgiT-type zinc finger domain-containing protein
MEEGKGRRRGSRFMEETHKIMGVPHVERCPICGGELVEKEVEKVLKGGANTAILKVKAEVCLHCGERLYRPETVTHFEEIREKLSTEDVGEFEPVGKTYQVA